MDATTGVLIVGAATPVGRSVAEALGDAGVQLVLTDVNGAHLEEVVEAIAGRTGRRPERALLPVTDPDAWTDVVAGVVERFGRLDLVVNAAEFDPPTTWRDAALEDWMRAVDINLLGVVRGLAAALPALRRTRGALVVVAVSPSASVRGSTRAAAVAFVDAVRAEVGPEVALVTAVVRPGSEARAGVGIVSGLLSGSSSIEISLSV